MRKALLPLLFLCAACALARADVLLDQAAASEKAGDLEASASALAQWLGANPGASASPEVFASYLRVEQDFPRLLQSAAAFLKTARGVTGAAVQIERIARLFDLAGRVEEARDAYLSAFRGGAGDSTLVEAFLLSLRMNDSEGMAAALQQLKGKNASVEILLQALSDVRTGDRVAARAALMGLSQQSGDPDLALKSLWVLYQAAAAAGDAAGEADARARLGKRFPSSPEAALMAASPPGGTVPRQVVLPAPVPDVFGPGALSQPAAAVDPAVDSAARTPSSPAAAPGAASAPTASPTTAAPVPPVPPAPGGAPAAGPRFSVQVGAFQVKENADDLLSELLKRGFAALVLHDTVQGRERWRVFAGSGLDRDAAEAVQLKLSGAGYLGVVVTDK